MNVISKKIGIVGGGQLGKMMILEAKRLGFYVVTLDPEPDCPSKSISDELIISSLNNPEAYFELAGKVDVITYEWELINAQIMDDLQRRGHLIYPSVASLKIIQNKYTQNKTLRESGVPVPRFELVGGVEAIRGLGEKFGYPLMLKTTLGGYDGKGVAMIRSEAEIEGTYKLMGSGKIELMVEEFVDFACEISIIATRGIDGSCVIYPIAENSHKNSILDTTIAPARVSVDVAQKATEIAHRVMDVFDGVGTFGVEMFVSKSGEVSVNEIAPRPHNSGHYTIEGCFANQFENHIRAITGLPLGNVELLQPSVMVNLLGESGGPAHLLGLEEIYAADPNIHVHFYGKKVSKIGRKMGHFTVVDQTVEGALQRAERAKSIVKVTGGPQQG